MQKRKIGEQDLGRLFFTADLHLGHANILKPDYADRPWDDVEAMDKGLIEAWNAKVPEEGIVVVAGDLFWDGRRAQEYLKQLNGRIIYVLGDHGDKVNEALFESVYHLLWLKMPGDRPGIFVNHWAQRRWPKAHYGSWHLFGHSHGELPPWGRSFDCGVDDMKGDYAPLTYYEVAMRIAGIEQSPMFEETTHHGKRGT